MRIFGSGSKTNKDRTTAAKEPTGSRKPHQAKVEEAIAAGEPTITSKEAIMMNRWVTSFVNAIPAWFILLFALLNIIKLTLIFYILKIDPVGLYSALAKDGFSPNVIPGVMGTWAGLSVTLFFIAIYQYSQHGGWRGPV